MKRALKIIGATIAGAALLAIPATASARAQADVRAEWIRHYTSDYGFAFATDVATDKSGNVYVTGPSYAPNGNPDYATIKYSSSGDVLWARLYNGPADSWDNPTQLALDTSGNVYVTGESDGPDFFDYATIKYSTSGVQEWVARYTGPDGGDDRANALAVDGSGNVYVTGWSSASATFYDYATVKYSPSGVQQWAARYNGPGNTRDRARALAVDGSGNVYVTGDSGEGSSNQSDYVTVKYDSSGVQRWIARYTNLYDYATALALDGSGNVYVTGYSHGGSTGYDYATIKYNAMGTQRWVRRFHGDLADDFAYALAVDASGNVYVTGEGGPRAGNVDYATVKYSTRGSQRWVAYYNGPGNAVDIASAIAVDASGSVYVTGASRGAETEDDYATVKYGPRGGQRWVARFNGPENTFDLATALALDAAGNVYVTGNSIRTGGSMFTTIKYVQS